METFEALVQENRAAGLSDEEARFEAGRYIRLTTGDPYAHRTDEELAEMRAVEFEQIEQARRTAGISDEFPSGEFAVAGFNC